MRLILVRHGQTDWNQENRVQGFSDIGLNEVGRNQAERLARALKLEGIEAIYSSPLKRTLETARAISRFHQVKVETDDGLKELNTGELEGLTSGELRSRYGEFMKEWMRDATAVRMPGGESLTELQDRAWASIHRIKDKYPNGAVIVVSHNFAILSIICKALGFPLSGFRKLKQDEAAVNIIELGERGATLALFNDTCHLKTQPEYRSDPP